MIKLKTKIVVIPLILISLSTIIVIGQEYRKQKAELEAIQQELAEYKANEIEIYPCPFCGSEDTSVVDMWDDGKTCYVRCNDCFGSGPMNNPNTENANMSKAEAIEWWNHNARE